MSQNVFFILESVFEGKRKVIGVFDSIEKARAIADDLINKGLYGWTQYKKFNISSCVLNTTILSSETDYPNLNN